MNQPSSTQLTQLKSMFPGVDNTVIASVFNAQKGNMDQTIESLLSMNQTTLTPQDKEKAKRENFNSVVAKVLRMPADHDATQLASKYGLNIQTVCWEDTARTKG